MEDHTPAGDRWPQPPEPQPATAIRREERLQTGDRWARQFMDRNLALPEQKARAASLFVRLQILVYVVILLGITIALIKILV